MPPKARQNSRNLIKKEGRILLALYALKIRKLQPFMAQPNILMCLAQYFKTNFVVEYIAMRYMQMVIN
jgi:hypothetical protein